MEQRELDLRSRISFAVEELAQLDRDFANIVLLLDRQAVLQETSRILTQQFGFHAAWIAEANADGDAQINHALGNNTERFNGVILRRGLGLGGKVFAVGSLNWVQDYTAAETITHHYDQYVRDAGIRRMIAAPVRHADEQIGVLLAGLREPGEFGERAGAVLETVATRTAQALLVAENARHAAEVAVYQERQRLALDLHDTIGAMLFAIGAGVRSVTEETNIDAGLQQRLVAIEQQASEAANALRASLRALRTSPDELALGTAIQAACHRFEERTGVKAKLVMFDALHTLSEARVRALVAAVKEGLLNVAKHAQATEVVVTVDNLREGVAITIIDNGVGLAREKGDHHGYGRDAIGAALRQLGGDLKMYDLPEGGASFRAWVPY
mgnify:CR=1 FL=1